MKIERTLSARKHLVLMVLLAFLAQGLFASVVQKKRVIKTKRKLDSTEKASDEKKR